ncbi:hypothetical protein [Nonlabens sp.]|uniref:hypothetical protein n=1 Tax=Nonlabens sp. TaxID=1888209 RepID=UPI003265BCDF
MIKNIIVFLILIISLPIMNAQEIPLKQLETQPTDTFGINSKTILENEIEGIQVDHVALGDKKTQTKIYIEGHRTIYLFMKGSGIVTAGNKTY